MPKFTKKPVTIEARQWDGTAEGATPLINWILDADGTARFHDSDPGDPNCPNAAYHVTHVYCPTCSFMSVETPYLVIDTLEGRHRADAGDWIVQGVKGEFYPVKPDIFAETYAPEKPKYVSRGLAVDYRGVRHELLKEGCLVRSMYSTSGAVWRVLGFEEKYGNTVLLVESVTTGRNNRRDARNFHIVEVSE